MPGLIIRRRYEILDKIGVGGMASVYRARHIAFSEIRAIKVVRGWLTEDEDFVRRLRSEAMIARKLNHPNAVHVDDLDELEDGRPFIVMEFVEGKNVREVIREVGPLRPARALRIARQVADALGAAHALHIVHRDVKPDNIVLVQRDGTEDVKVMDFGIAKIVGAPSGNNFETRAGVVLCTPEYASPEQARGTRAEELDGRSDLYSLGVVLYEMLTGTLPFVSDTPIGMLLAQINTAPRTLTEANPDLNLPECIMPVLAKALEKNAANRFQTASEFVQAIASVEEQLAKNPPDNVISMPLRHATVPAEVPSTPPSDAPPIDLLDEVRGDSRSRAWIWVVALIVAIGVGFGAWRWMKSSQDTSAKADAVTRRVREALAKDAAAKSIQANVNNGVVVLSGQAASEDSLERVATELARVEGVYQVSMGDVRVVKAEVPAAVAPASSAAPASAPSSESTAKASVVPSPDAAKPTADLAAPATSPAANTARPDPRVLELLSRARQEHDQGLYDDEIRDYDAVLKIDRNNGAALRGKRTALKAKQNDPGSQ